MLRGETSQNDQLSYPGGGLRSDNLPAHAKHHSPDSRMSLSSSETTFTHPSSTTPLLGSYTGSKPSLPPSHPGILRRTQSSPASSPPRFDSPTEDRIPAMFKSASAPNQRISRAKKGKRVHACQHQGCEKIFTRAEHLRRHQLNHNSAVYYKCDICDKTFVRQDLLSRHIERHATQARKAVQTLALAQRHRQFSSHFGFSGITVVSVPPQSQGHYVAGGPTYNTNPHPYPHTHSPDQPRINISSMAMNCPATPGHHSHPTSPTAAQVPTQTSERSLSNYGQHYSPSMSISPTGDFPVNYSAETTPSPSANVRRPQLHFHQRQNETPRPPGYSLSVTSNPEVNARRHTPGDDQHSPNYPQVSVPGWETCTWTSRPQIHTSRKPSGSYGDSTLPDR